MLKTLDDMRIQVDNAYEFKAKVDSVYRIQMGTAYELQTLMKRAYYTSFSVTFLSQADEGWLWSKWKK
jgi:hypothetical protein